MYPLYIKKEDVRDVVTWQRRAGGIILIGLSFSVAMMQFLVAPKLMDLYTSFEITPPVLVKYSFLLSLILFVGYLLSAFSLLLSKPNYSRVDRVAKKYKRGEMIKAKELIDYRFEWLFFGALVVMVGFFIFTLILPISKLTGQY